VNISLALALLLRRFFASVVGEGAASSAGFLLSGLGLRSFVLTVMVPPGEVGVLLLLSVLIRGTALSGSASFSFLPPKTRLRNPPVEVLRSVVPASLKTAQAPGGALGGQVEGAKESL
jgi:hypothetical protein